MAESKTLVQLHKKGDATALIYGQTVAEGVIFNDNENLQDKLTSLVNKIEVVKIGNDALVIGNDKTVTIPEFYSKTESDNKYATKDEVSAIPKFAVEVVESLPTTGIKTDKIYLVVTGEEEDNLYTEYIRVGNKWEKLGTQKCDISGKQDNLSDTQMQAVNSGITAEKVAAYDAYATGKQNALTDAQMLAANSGITATKVSTYDGYATGKQDTLSEAQLNAANSGITTTKVAAYDAYATNKQDKLSETQLNAANSGITAEKVAAYDAYAGTISGLDFVEYTIIKTL